MYLARLEVQGFKTFAKRTVIDFPKPKADLHPLTVIVGPNGSGKSNLTDAMRWCLGEQSMKHLRGKSTQDVIFSGSKGHTRSGVAEVIMVFDNNDGALDIDYNEVTITRRLYRDGESEYLLNGRKARLSDIQLLLAQAGIGQRTYTVIGQGMIDHVLTSSPEERKIFFDDATGVRGLQIKRHQSMLKLKKATENLIEVELLLGEIEPRLRMLKRQVKRLEKREIIEKELREVQERYYGTLWHTLHNDLEKNTKESSGLQQKIEKQQLELARGDEDLAEMEKEMRQAAKEVHDAGRGARETYRKAQEAVNTARRKQFEAERDLALSQVKAESSWSPLPLKEIIQELDDILKNGEKLGIIKLLQLARNLRKRLVKPQPEEAEPDPVLVKAFERAKTATEKARITLKEVEADLEKQDSSSNSSNTKVFELQRSLRKVQTELHALESRENKFNIERARIETRIENAQSEMREELGDQAHAIQTQKLVDHDHRPEETRSKMLKLKHQLELIGGIDEETIEEYKETEERYTFLDSQLTDLQEAIKATEKMIDELDDRIAKQSEKAFKKINDEFQKYFKVLFGGGSCSLIKLKESEPEAEDNRIALDRASEELAEEAIAAEALESPDSEGSIAQRALARFKKRKDTVSGIDIQATPPGKKLKALNLLSGGERALTSIALLSAIMATNPSPFVVLDEVDAALDEANTLRFANILDELRKLTQFIVVTHNRATMERGDMLYGVTMGDDGISNLLSVALSDIEDAGSARR
jgi:chromosome segregation ATPase